MGSFNRDRNSRPGPARYASASVAGGGGGHFKRPSFGGGNRGFDRSNGPVTMFSAVCDNCGKDCQVPFRPTSGKPIFCSSCFESKREGGEARRPEGRFERSEERQMYDAVCDECGNSCKVPFQPSGGKPIYCSNCFGEKKGAGGDVRGNGPSHSSQPNYKQDFEMLSSKLERILQLLETQSQPKKQKEAAVALEVKAEKEVVKKVAKKKTPKKN